MRLRYADMQSSHLLIHALQTAGLVLANRLSENSSVTVAVLEAGKAHFEDPLVGMYSLLMH